MYRDSNPKFYFTTFVGLTIYTQIETLYHLLFFINVLVYFVLLKVFVLIVLYYTILTAYLRRNCIDANTSEN